MYQQVEFVYLVEVQLEQLVLELMQVQLEFQEYQLVVANLELDCLQELVEALSTYSSQTLEHQLLLLY